LDAILCTYYSPISDSTVRVTLVFKKRNPLTDESEPRYASLPNIMKAKKKPIEKFVPEDLGVDFTPQIETLKVREPPSRVGGVKVANVDELIGKLKEAGIL
jgi:electron transfer flavoprotein alpha/beta subunit